MISPYTRFTIKGAIWYQGETDSDAARAPYYLRVFSTLISDWRNQWGEGNFPFFFVQISSYNSPNPGWPVVRDAQRRTLFMRNTGMAVTLDVGTPNNVHPPDKQTVGNRLALAALAGRLPCSRRTRCALPNPSCSTFNRTSNNAIPLLGIPIPEEYP